MLLFAENASWASELPIVAVLVGLVGLVAGAELLVRGAVWIALTLGMSQMAVGLTLVSIGTSLPELLVTLTAADDHADLAMGNVMGSNVANILLIVGVTASIRAIRLSTRWFELSFLMLLTALLCFPFFGAHLARWRGRAFPCLCRRCCNWVQRSRNNNTLRPPCEVKCSGVRATRSLEQVQILPVFALRRWRMAMIF